MSTPKRQPRSSGNPAKRAEAERARDEARAASREDALSDYRRNVSKRNRSTALWWTVGSVAAIAVIGGVVASYVFSPAANAPEYSEGGTGAVIDGVETFDLANDHVEGEVAYDQSPPAGGPHNRVWLNCGVYDQPQANENAVHSLEHGAVWVTYDPEQVTDDDIATLEGVLPTSYALMSPYPGMDTPVAVSAWNAQLKVDSAADDRIPEFFEEYWRHQDVPEPGALCTGAIDGPGKVS